MRPRLEFRIGHHVRRIIIVLAVELLALGLPRSAESETLHDERMVVLPLALFVGPIVGTNASAEDQLISLARILRERLANRAESDEPEAGGHLTSGALLIPARVIVADQAEACVESLTLRNQLRVAGKIANGSDSETVHRILLDERRVQQSLGAQSSAPRPAGNCGCLRLCAETPPRSRVGPARR